MGNFGHVSWKFHLGIGFEASDPWKSGNRSDGCFRKNALQCGNNTNNKGAGDGFPKLSKVVVPRKPLTLDVQSIGQCRSSCLNNCSCTGYSYIDQNSSIWIGDLINLQQLSANDTSGTDFFLKLAAADLDSGSKNNGEDLLSFELDISPAPTKNEQSEVKRQHKKEAAIEEVGEVGEGKLLKESRKSGEGWGESKNEAMLIAKLRFLVAALKEMATNYSQGCEGQQHFVG